MNKTEEKVEDEKNIGANQISKAKTDFLNRTSLSNNQ